MQYISDDVASWCHIQKLHKCFWKNRSFIGSEEIEKFWFQFIYYSGYKSETYLGTSGVPERSKLYSMICVKS